MDHVSAKVEDRDVRIERLTALVARTPVATALYCVIAVAMTWPVARFLGTHLASDVHDPAFNCWVLAWTTGQILLVLQGDLTGITNFWNGNIFYPEPLTLAYSEHLFAQALQVLPIQALTGNILLSYNLLFISTYALSGLSVYMLIRELTGRPWAAIVAGLAFAYAPYRLSQVSHVQVLSSYWMPFALLGFHRYFSHVAAAAPSMQARRALAGGVVATAMQNLSCGYYMLFFSPFVAAYCVYEIVRFRLGRRLFVWVELGVAACFIAVVTWPFASAYLQLREVADMGVRSLRDLVQFSADTYAFVTPPRRSWMSSLMSGYRKAEGAGFPGMTILALATVGVGWGLREFAINLRWKSLRDWNAVAITLAGVLCVGSAAVLLWFFVNGSLTVTIGARTLRYTDATLVLTVFLTSLAATMLCAHAARPSEAGTLPAGAGFFATAAMATAFLAMGPEIQTLGRRVSDGPYLWLFELLPGFDGLRVPARYLMLTTLFLSVLAGLGAAAVLAWRRPLGPVLVAAATVGILAEGWMVPMSMNAGGRPDDGLLPPPPLTAGRFVPPIYEIVRSFPEPIALMELPFGDPVYETRAVFYAGHHRKPIVNGYSGWFPRNYRRNASALGDVLGNPERAVRALARSGATHVLVHESAWPSDQGRRISDWLVSLGARLVSSIGSDRLLALPRLTVPPE